MTFEAKIGIVILVSILIGIVIGWYFTWDHYTTIERNRRISEACAAESQRLAVEFAKEKWSSANQET